MIAGLAPSMWLLVAGRALQGFGAGAIPTVAYVCVGRGFPPDLRPKVFAVLSTAWVLPSLVAPLAASGVARAFGWRWVFLGLIPVALVVGGIAVHAVRSLGRPAQAGHHEGNRVGLVARLSLGSAVLLGGLTAVTWWLALPLTTLGLVLVVPAFTTSPPAGAPCRCGPGCPPRSASAACSPSPSSPPTPSSPWPSSPSRGERQCSPASCWRRVPSPGHSAR